MVEPIRPIYSKIDEWTGKPIFGLSFTDFTRVEQGYGCPHCLAVFEQARHGNCPDCHEEMRSNAVAPLPEEWR